MPILLAGGGYKHVGYVARDQDRKTPLCCLFVTMLNKMTIPTEAFASGTG